MSKILFKTEDLFDKDNIPGDTLSYENLKSIYQAMKIIKKMVRSDNFEAYFDEIIMRMNVHERSHLKTQ